ncbi:MAG TPA: MarR family transcriptional regulator [Gemmatimonadaceae bacterium]
MPSSRTSRDLTAKHIAEGMRRHSTAAVLFHHALAERLGLGPTDLKCFDLIRERGAMTASEVATVTGLTTGAITGVVGRLENAGYLKRAADPNDGRRQILSPISDSLRQVHAAFTSLHEGLASVLADFNQEEIAAIAEFLDRSTGLLSGQVVAFRADRGAFVAPTQSKTTRQGGRR